MKILVIDDEPLIETIWSFEFQNQGLEFFFSNQFNSKLDPNIADIVFRDRWLFGKDFLSQSTGHPNEYLMSGDPPEVLPKFYKGVIGKDPLEAILLIKSLNTGF